MVRSVGVKQFGYAALLVCAVAIFVVAGCGGHNSDASAEVPPVVTVVHEHDGDLIQVDHPELFPMATAIAHDARSQLDVTGVVMPDISRNVPVTTLASGRVVSISARLGDTVRKGDLLLTVRSSDVSGGYSDYRKAVADEALAHTQLDRAKDLSSHGAISLNDLQVAQDAEEKAKVDVETTAEHLRLIGNDPDKPNGVVNIYAPVSGVITDQQVTNDGGVQALTTNPFTISDLSQVWVICDVHENELPDVRLDDTVDVRLNAYPDRIFHGRVSNISAILDSTLRTAKVRIQLANPGIMRLGMFVTATFRGQKLETHTAIPASAILHLQDRDWVFVAGEDKKFERVEVASGNMLPGNMQEVLSGIKPGAQVVQNALVLQNAMDQ